MTACPSDDALTGYIDRSSADRDGIAAHLDGCDGCRAIVIAAVRAGVATPVTEVEIVRPGAAAKRDPFQIGAKIGRFDVRALIGGGGMGHVYECYDRELDRAIALKVLRPDLRGAAAILAERLIRESRMMAKVTHPAVITVHDIGREGDFVFIAMELIRGTTLGEFARGKPWREVVALYERAGEGLAAAHKAGIVHRDFKPDNVLIETATERVVVTDFGIARAATEGDASAGTPRTGDLQLTTTGAAIGTPAYMAPEQLAGKPVDVRADVFAFSVSLWESLFGERPFPGTTVKAIEAAMQQPPRASGDVPRRIVRVLERGLAIDPEERWPELPAMLRALAVARTGSKKVWIATGAGAVVTGVAAIVVLTRPAASPDPCAAGLAGFADSFDPIALHALLGADPDVATRVLDRTGRIAKDWRAAHEATCVAERTPVQPAAVAACLEARRLELASFVDDVRADGPTFAIAQVKTIGDPATCTLGAPSLTTANVPEAPALRRAVTKLRNRMTEVRVLGQNNQLAKVDFRALVADAKATWPRVHAEALYLFAMAQAQNGEAKAAKKTFAEAAAIAQHAHHDLVAADAWIDLTGMATFDDGDAARGLEYLTYAEAALDRLGRPLALDAQLAYVKGTTLIEANRVAEAEVSLRRAVELAEAKPDTLPQAIQGLGFLYERQGRYDDAIAAYRRALGKLAAIGEADSANDAVIRARLALNLGLVGKGVEAETEARRALALAERLFAPDSPDRSAARETLAHVLHNAGKHEEALALARATKDEVGKAQGERSKHYADLMLLEGEILDGIGRYAEAAKAFDRGCDILAFEAGSESTPVAQCRVSQARSLAALGKRADALAIVDRAVPLLRVAYGEAHPLVANALVTRGEIHGELGHRALAIEDLEKAISILEKAAFDPGLLGAAQFALGKQLADRERARKLVETAAGTLATAPGTWKATHAAAVAWLARR